MKFLDMSRALTLACTLVVFACSIGACVDEGVGTDGGLDVDELVEAGVDSRPEASVLDSGVDATPDAWVWATEPCDATFIELPMSGDTYSLGSFNWDRYVVYDDWRVPGMEKLQDVYLYDLHTCTEFQMTDAPNVQFYPLIWDLKIGWTDTEMLESLGYSKLIMFDIQAASFSNLSQLTSANLAVFNDRYLIHYTNEGEIDPQHYHPMLWDRWSSDELVIAESWQGAEHFSISETHAAWIASCQTCGGISDVFYMDLATREIVHLDSTIVGNQLSTTTWGDYVLWQDDRDGGNWSVYVHRISTAETRELIDDQVERWYPYLRGHLLTMTSCAFSSDCATVGGDVVLFDLETEVSRRVTSTPGSYWPLYAHGDWLVYREQIVGMHKYKLFAVHMDAAGLVDATGHVVPD